MVRGRIAPKGPGGWREGRPATEIATYHYSQYVYSPYAQPVYMSPWYYYNTMPAYIPANAVVIHEDYACNWTDGDFFALDDTKDPLDKAVQEIKDGFEHKDTDYMAALFPQDGTVGIFADGQYEYELRPLAFQDMFSDTVRGAQTVDFDITEVTKSDDTAIVRAKHVTQGADGAEQTVLQTYRLKSDGDGNYKISDFMTSLG